MGVLKVTDELVKQYKEHGFAVIPGFLSPEEVDHYKKSTDNLVNRFCQDAPISVYGEKPKDWPPRDPYFAESCDKVRGFYEKAAFDENFRFLGKTPKDGLNKVAHAVHKHDPNFRALTFSSKVKEVVNKFTEMKSPTVCQSMVIFKNPKVGGVVIPHQDATYLYTEPTPRNLMGLWIALDDASAENGCLYFVSGSHKSGKVYQRFVKNPDKNDPSLFVYRGEPVPKPEAGKLVAGCCKAGDLVLIDGLVIHQSEPNLSDKPRMAYTFHVIEGEAKWSEENWLQNTELKNFEKFSDVKL